VNVGMTHIFAENTTITQVPHLKQSIDHDKSLVSFPRGITDDFYLWYDLKLAKEKSIERMQDPDGLPALIMSTKRALAGAGVSEKQWATEFLKQRRMTLSNANSQSTQAVRAESIGPVDTLRIHVNQLC
jgi:hypothetical protein